AAFEQVVDAEFMSDLPDVDRLAAVPEARVAGNDGISLALRKLGDDPLGDGVTEISLIRTGTHVVEGKYRNPGHVARTNRGGSPYLDTVVDADHCRDENDCSKNAPRESSLGSFGAGGGL